MWGSEVPPCIKPLLLLHRKAAHVPHWMVPAAVAAQGSPSGESRVLSKRPTVLHNHCLCSEGWACSRQGTSFNVAGAGWGSSMPFLLGLRDGLCPVVLCCPSLTAPQHSSLSLSLLLLFACYFWRQKCVPDVLLGMQWKSDFWVFLGIWLNSFVINPGPMCPWVAPSARTYWQWLFIWKSFPLKSVVCYYIH